MLAKQDVSDAIDDYFSGDNKEVDDIKPVIGKDVSALSFAANKVYYGSIGFGKLKRQFHAEFTAKLGLTSGVGQVAKPPVTLSLTGPNNYTIPGCLLSSAVSKNAYAVFDGYEITLQASGG